LPAVGGGEFVKLACRVVWECGKAMVVTGLAYVLLGHWQGWLIAKSGAGLMVISAAYKAKVIDRKERWRIVAPPARTAVVEVVE
jgi:hypothetical protein